MMIIPLLHLILYVYHALRNIDPSKSKGPDNLGGKMLKTLADSLAEPICELFNMSVRTATVPSIWKTASIIPIPKLTGASEPKDFRPIALTSLLAKCLERLVSQTLTDKISDENQFAYKHNRGTDDAVMVLIDKVSQHLDSNAQNYTRAVFIDFSSAFNTIDGTIMIDRLKDKNVHQNIISWVSSFLTNRRQYVSVNGEISTTTLTSVGSPQGCVLSPILFSLYVEKMCTSTPNFSLLKYADDTIILENLHRGENSKLQSVLDSIAAWCAENHLLINSSKTKELLFTNQRHNPNPDPVTINSSTIERVTQYKYLGTMLTSKLKFAENTEVLTDKVSKRLYIMKRLSSLGVSTTTIKLAYEAFIESILSYHLVILYKHLSSDDLRELNHVVRVAYRLSKGRLQCQTIEDLYKSRLKTKCLRMLCQPDAVLTLDKYPSGRYIVPKHRTNLRKHSFRYQAILFLNDTFK